MFFLWLRPAVKVYSFTELKSDPVPTNFLANAGVSLPLIEQESGSLLDTTSPSVLLKFVKSRLLNILDSVLGMFLLSS